MRRKARGITRFFSPGFKYNLTDIGAAIGIEQLKKCDAFGAARNRIATAYNEGVLGLTGDSDSGMQTRHQHAWHLYVIQLRSGTVKD